MIARRQVTRAVVVAFACASSMTSTAVQAAEATPPIAGDGAAKPEPPKAVKTEAKEAPKNDDGWPDISNFLDSKFGFLPIVRPITEPAVGYGAPPRTSPFNE
jgi:hypothetical protein